MNKEIICYTLEKPWMDNQNNISSIPTGKYNAIIRYDHNDHWRIELKNVPNRDNVQIHIGNSVDDSKGCILVGLGHNGSDVCTLTKSTKAYLAIKKAFYGSETPTASPDLSIIVMIED